jgi:hypothetical protein
VIVMLTESVSPYTDVTLAKCSSATSRRFGTPALSATIADN